MFAVRSLNAVKFGCSLLIIAGILTCFATAQSSIARWLLIIITTASCGLLILIASGALALRRLQKKIDY